MKLPRQHPLISLSEMLGSSRLQGVPQSLSFHDMAPHQASLRPLSPVAVTWCQAACMALSASACRCGNWLDGPASSTTREGPWTGGKQTRIQGKKQYALVGVPRMHLSRLVVKGPRRGMWQQQQAQHATASESKRIQRVLFRFIAGINH
eukprot:879804-Pelagomonas_calceolata.AAC.6